MTEILFFAQAARWMGRASLELELDRPLSLTELLRRPELAPLSAAVSGTRFAVNHEFASLDSLVSPGDEVAVLPPVSGG